MEHPYKGFRQYLFVEDVFSIFVHKNLFEKMVVESEGPQETRKMIRQAYDTDLTDDQWQILEPLIQAAQPGGRPRSLDMREVLNAIFYLLANGIKW